jgi:hypothetical protein
MLLVVQIGVSLQRPQPVAMQGFWGQLLPRKFLHTLLDRPGDLGRGAYSEIEGAENLNHA